MDDTNQKTTTEQLAKDALEAGGLAPGNTTHSLTRAASSNPPAEDSIFPLFTRDSDNPEGDAQITIFPDKLTGDVDKLTPTQLKTAQLIQRFVGAGHSVQLPQNKLSGVLAQIRQLTDAAGYGASQIPMICTGPLCPMVQDAKRAANPAALPDLSKCRCSLYAAGAHPLGKNCPLEMIQDAMLRTSLVQALDISLDEVVHVHLVGELVSWMTIRSRILNEMGVDPFITYQAAVGIIGKGPNAETATRRELDPRLDALERVQNQINNIRKQLNATPEAQAKLAMRDNQPRGSRATTIEAKANSIARVENLKAVTLSPDQLTAKEE